ncbi:MAG: TRAP transporter large permease [bacterium]|jgi:tripartite ATP-independent transporter DctM subunit
MGTVLFVSFIILLVLAVPIPFALGISSLLALLTGEINFIVVPQKILTGTDSFSLLAVPFFILAGDLMHRGGLARRLVNMAAAVFGYVTGGLAMVTVVASMFFAAISGSAPATTAAIGGVMIPEMEERGYRRDFGVALATASGPIGQMIPPSIPMVIWAVMANLSISRMFLAGIGPGIVTGIGLMIVSYIIARKEGWKGTGIRPTARRVLRAFLEGFWALMAPVIILGGIYGGIFTPTEAAAVSVVYGFIVSMFVYRELKWRDIPELVINSARTTTMVIFVISVASLFGWLMAHEQLGNVMVDAILSISRNRIVVLLMLNILLLILGCLMDNIAAMVILCGVLTTVAAEIGVDPIQFGVMVVVNFAVGMATPPIGYSLFVGAAISGLTIEQVSRALWPFLIVMIIAIFLITYIPAITLTIPNLLLG